MKFNKWITWRVINSGVIFLSFFAPFAVMEWGIPKDINQALLFSGFRMLDYHQHMVSHDIFVFMVDKGFLEQTRAALIESQRFLGLYSILFYCMASPLLILLKSKLFDKPAWTILALCLIALGLRNIWIILALDIGLKALSNALIGFWLILIGLVSAIILETSYLFSRRI